MARRALAAISRPRPTSPASTSRKRGADGTGTPPSIPANFTPRSAGAVVSARTGPSRPCPRARLHVRVRDRRTRRGCRIKQGRTGTRRSIVATSRPKAATGPQGPPSAASSPQRRRAFAVARSLASTSWARGRGSRLERRAEHGDHREEVVAQTVSSLPYGKPRTSTARARSAAIVSRRRSRRSPARERRSQEVREVLRGQVKATACLPVRSAPGRRAPRWEPVAQQMAEQYGRRKSALGAPARPGTETPRTRPVRARHTICQTTGNGATEGEGGARAIMVPAAAMRYAGEG
jgi:hypothetical protein